MLTGKALFFGLFSLFVIWLSAPACAATTPPISVVAAENVWGSVVLQLGGNRVRVHSIITDPNADPHEFESDVATARAVADARYVVINGVGYDAWVEKLLAANPGQRDVLRAGDVVGKRPGDNPHLWYDPAYVARVADRITADLERIDPANRAYYRRQRAAFAQACRPYLDIIATIRKRDRNRKVGATEDIVEYLTAAAGLDLTTPPAFMQAVANGTEPPTGSVVTFHQQVESHAIALLLYNVQTSTSVTSEIRRHAQANHIPIVPVTETVVPANGRFGDWQFKQLRLLESALGR
jgi:zinc/manganese transport system substrate-binding protein